MSKDADKVTPLNDLIGDGMLEICPHCTQRQAHYEVEGDNTLLIKCLCGYLAVLYDDKDTVIVNHVLSKTKSELPRKGSKLSKCLGAVASQYPDNVKTDAVSKLTKDTTSGAASKLMVLQHKGLVEKINSLRGVAGGSTWALTNRGINHLNLPIGVL